MDPLWASAMLFAATALGCVSGYVASAWFHRHNPDAPTIEELAAAVDSLQRSVRKLTMQRVRAGTRDPAAEDSPSVLPPAASVEGTKAALRSRVFSQLRTMKTQGGEQ